MKRTLAVLALLALAGCAHLREAPLWVPAVTLTPIVMLDASVTIDVCRRHGCEEVNPFSAPFARSQWLYVANGALLAFVVAWGHAAWHEQHGPLRYAWVPMTIGQGALSLYAWRHGVALRRRLRSQTP